MPWSPPFWLALFLLAVWTGGALLLVLGGRRIPWLRDQAPVPPADAPRVSVVVAARDEERGIGEALRSVLAQRYPALEVVVVDDRSTDATGPILDRMALAEPRLRVIHLDRLPPGWLGKNHALHRGAEHAGGEWILFTDADVVMHPEAVARAVGFARRAGADHVAAAPGIVAPGPLLNLFVGAFALFFAQFSRPWKVRDPRSSRHVGVGAFNLVRTEAYRAVGGHRPIAMRPDDDLKLGKLLKRAGHRQEVLVGRGLVSVEWYPSLGEAVRGLEKNSFAALEYSVPAVVGSVLAMLLLNVWPFVAALVVEGPARWLYAATAGVAVGSYALSTRVSGANPWYGFAFPAASLIFVYVVVRATCLALLRGGIRWRGTHYPLDELRANRV